MKPYYDRDGITVYHSRWEDVLAAGLIPVREVALVHADPPYGQSERTARGAAGRGHDGSPRRSKRLAAARDFPAIVGDNAPFDPAGLLALSRPAVLWGAQRYGDKLPASPSWLWWDKRDGVEPDDNGDGEMAWTNLGGPPRQFSHLWRGAIRESERGTVHLHPTQKPIALCSWVYVRAKLKRGDLVLVPYMGSGPDLAACVAMGLRCIACEVEKEYCRVAVGARLHAAHAAPVVESPGPLFAPR